jgi:hypothetical protein
LSLKRIKTSILHSLCLKQDVKVQAQGLFVLGGGELILAYAAHRTLKIIGEILELGSGLDAGLEIAEILIIDISADITYKFSH